MILDLHTAWAWVVVVGNALAGLWCLGAHWWPPLRVRAIWAFVVLMEATIFVQVALGVYMVAVEDITAPGMHMFYGFISIVAVAVIYGYRTQLRAWQFLLYGSGGMFLAGLGIRSMLLG
ncbi:MAG: hypothetical protein ACYC2O_13300 [Microthrixaceae bacterium]